jgi:Fibronectin type III domain
MHLFRRASRALRLTLLAAALVTGFGVPPATRAAEAPEPSDIVIVLDYSSSILDDEVTRAAFGDALDRIAARVDEISDTLVDGDMTVSFVLFASSAVEDSRCVDVSLRDNPEAVNRFADCLRDFGSTYRNGGSEPLAETIGTDTNYVDAMQVAAERLPADSTRPAIIFFTDGRHDIEGVPVSEVIPARNDLFADRAPFGLLPVGLGVNPVNRAVLEQGLSDLRMINELERCEGGLLEWPDVVFETAEDAGLAVAVALQDVSCTFTVPETPTPPPPRTPTPAPPTPEPTLTAAAVREIRMFPGDSSVDLRWTEPADVGTSPVEGYQARCTPSAGGEPVQSDVVTETSVVVEGLANGAEYRCEVATVRGGVPGAWTPASGVLTPFGPPPAPNKPNVQPQDRSALITVTIPAEAPVTGIAYECSPDGGRTWAVRREFEGGPQAAEVNALTNGVEYVCRAIASNAAGVGAPSPHSDAFKPCSGLVECNPLVVPIFGLLLAALALALGWLLWRWYASRRVWITAQVDNFYTVTLGRGPSVGMSFARPGRYREPTGVTPAEGREAEVRITYKGSDRFEVRSGDSRQRATVGRVVQVVDAKGVAHRVVLGAYDEEPQPLRREA